MKIYCSIAILSVALGVALFASTDPNSTAEPNSNAVVVLDPNDFVSRIQAYQAHKQMTIGAYDEILKEGGYADQLLASARALADEGKQIYLDAEKEAKAKGLDWEQQKKVLSIVEYHLDRPDWEAKHKAVDALDKLIDITRNEMADEYISDRKERERMFEFTNSFLEILSSEFVKVQK